MKALTFILYSYSLLFLLSGCKKTLDVENVAAFDPNKVWNDPQLAQAYLTNLYAQALPGSWPVNSGGYADELAGNLQTDAVTSASGPFKDWPYATIRNINILFNEIDKGTLSDDTKNPIKGQGYFLRAWVYFNMVILYGGVPIIDKPQGLNDDLFVARNSTKECFDFIEADLQQALTLLPDKYSGDDRGRIDKAAVLAFLGRVLLFKASPQFHSSNPYNNADWSEAYEANKMAKDQLAAMGYGLVPNYADIWSKENKGNQEAILSVVFNSPNKTNGRQEDACRPLSESKNATGGDQPVWEMIEAFPMKDGYQPGASPNYAYDLQAYWQNRDPRFYNSIVYNGSIYELSNKAGRRQYTAKGIATNEDMFGPGELFNRTGFYPRKGMDSTLPQAAVTENETDWIELRYAEVLLNFAEAANETEHPAEVMSVLIEIRQRAGIEPGPANLYGLSAGMTREQLREAIYHERRIEFIYEGKRFNDLRRTRRLNLIDGMSKHGLLATLKPGKDPAEGITYSLLPEDFTYSILPLLSNGTNVMSTPDTYYFFPIPKSEIDKNLKLEQNIGWDGGTFNPVLD
ncbi:RagB/SusD family nutrient uptake outer membrane protein [Ilyomonas limi]|uniref:RagB/SusD family nutrient uptake outer membrane protein n=1 Tax=Ilyomonas limi TaxID=2575867 RepID=A0A4U3KRZ2_9BACT|nr:RagB/SusD family nutrient uptake outer membrane protein [Ilyomonas limi]TKK65118.1 RagB/SusD family nutrient uptake outer membrane protein [Ilyomonas limi]